MQQLGMPLRPLMSISGWRWMETGDADVGVHPRNKTPNWWILLVEKAQITRYEQDRWASQPTASEVSVVSEMRKIQGSSSTSRMAWSPTKSCVALPFCSNMSETGSQSWLLSFWYRCWSYIAVPCCAATGTQLTMPWPRIDLVSDPVSLTVPCSDLPMNLPFYPNMTCESRVSLWIEKNTHMRFWQEWSSEAEFHGELKTLNSSHLSLIFRSCLLGNSCAQTWVVEPEFHCELTKKPCTWGSCKGGKPEFHAEVGCS